MSAAKHTPGPWQVNAGTIQAGDVRERVALGIVYLDWSEDFAEEGAANARLITAAPELLEALQLIVQWDAEGLALCEHHISRACAAITKATGERSMSAARTPESLDDRERVINANRSLWWALHNLLEACYVADAAEELGPQVDGTLLDAAAEALAATPLYRPPSQVPQVSQKESFSKCFAEVDARWQAFIARLEPGPTRDACERQRAAFVDMKNALNSLERAFCATMAPDDGPPQ
jgi:hypothetical protein